MSSTIQSAVLSGIEGIEVTITVEILSLLPSFQIVGLPVASVRETRERVRSAIASSGFDFPRKRIVVNVAPVDIAKRGTHLDLPIALAVLGATHGIDRLPFAIGELGLDGTVRPVRGAFPLVEANQSAIVSMVPEGNAAEAATATGAGRVVAVRTLKQAWEIASGRAEMLYLSPFMPPYTADGPDLADIRGMEKARRALEVAAAGRHSIALIGPPGCGKSMLARRLSSILPRLSDEESVDVFRIRSAAGLVPEGTGTPLVPPFRAPHHTCSAAGLLGGGHPVGPGEVTLAHRGVLLLDEAPEFPSYVIEGLQEVLSSKKVTLARADRVVTMPADFHLVVTSNPCPCGMGTGRCSCESSAVTRYKSRVPKTDIVVYVDHTSPQELLSSKTGESSEVVRERVVAARTLLNEGISCPANWVSPVASTIAALAGETMVTEEHMNEARSLTERPSP